MALKSFVVSNMKVVVQYLLHAKKIYESTLKISVEIKFEVCRIYKAQRAEEHIH